ncbi:hypothetical protein F935_01545 [Acinetobacter calcoaceticus ANC 3811]|uniref:Uncharacterized protein n=1 Tax=Acinetobacter calcoaceticus ANC 3811 TaxID=1217690 RepID=R8Y384_ACICA|nr:hypothetical protein [Acinetobacter calcoaceticus]EOQ63915.1 hypothetical protein F935_01545 [Acinetobacter calcoaceticus ANC 3811]
MSKLKIKFVIWFVIIGLVFLWILRSCSHKEAAPPPLPSSPTEYSNQISKAGENTVVRTEVLKESPSSEAQALPNETYKGKLLTRDYVHSLDDIKYFPAAAILLTGKWYTNKKSIKICERLVLLSPSINKEDEFVTYWLVQKKKLSSKENNCEYLMDLYNFDEATIELTRLFKGKHENKSIVKRVYGNFKIRGPYIVMYEDAKRDTDLIIDLNRLGPSATEYFIENWDDILATLEERGSLEKPGAAIKAALNKDKHLRELVRKDLMNNLVLWTKAGVCVGLVAASVTTTTVVGDGVVKFVTSTETMFQEAKDGKLKNKSYCAAISEIADQ